MTDFHGEPVHGTSLLSVGAHKVGVIHHCNQHLHIAVLFDRELLNKIVRDKLSNCGQNGDDKDCLPGADRPERDTCRPAESLDLLLLEALLVPHRHPRGHSQQQIRAAM